jgi:hypothetical protein
MQKQSAVSKLAAPQCTTKRPTISGASPTTIHHPSTSNVTHATLEDEHTKTKNCLVNSSHHPKKMRICKHLQYPLLKLQRCDFSMRCFLQR